MPHGPEAQVQTTETKHGLQERERFPAVCQLGAVQPLRRGRLRMVTNCICQIHTLELNYYRDQLIFNSY